MNTYWCQAEKPLVILLLYRGAGDDARLFSFAQYYLMEGVAVMNDEMEESMIKIRAIEDKYGLLEFRMALAQLVNVGISNLDKDYVEEEIEQILAQGEVEISNGAGGLITSDLLCESTRCSAELAEFGPWDLFRYIKDYVVIDKIKGFWLPS
jgi:hypothetical protein